MANDKQPSFTDRCFALHEAAEDLEDIAQIVAAEAERMAAAADSCAAWKIDPVVG
jgi:hypothetical protein